MNASADVIRSHIGYSAWASGLLVKAAGQLRQEELTRDFGTADKSVLGTLVHVFGADRLWLARLKREPANRFPTDADYQLAVLQSDWPALYRQWTEWAAGLTDEDAGADVAYTDMRGNPFRQPLGQLVLHVVNHGTHHRGQVSGFLRTMGYVPPKLDLVFYYRECRLGGAKSPALEFLHSVRRSGAGSQPARASQARSSASEVRLCCLCRRLATTNSRNGALRTKSAGPDRCKPRFSPLSSERSPVSA